MIYSLRVVRPDFDPGDQPAVRVPTTGRLRKLRFVLEALAAGVGPIGVTDPAKAQAE